MDLPGVDFVEKGHHDEGIENDGEMLGWRGEQRGPNARIDSQQFGALEQEDHEQGELVEGMATDVFAAK